MYFNTVQTFYEGDLNALHKYCLATFVKFGYEVHLYSYSISSVDIEGVVLINASEILDYNEKYLYVKNSFFEGNPIALLSDLFRIELLYKKGGWWIDTDVICLRRFDIINKSFVIGCESEDQLNNAVLFSIPHGAVISYIRSMAWRSMMSKNMKWGDVGPKLFSSLLNFKDDIIQIETTSSFYPISPQAVPFIFLFKMNIDFNVGCFKNAYFLHIYESTLRYKYADRLSSIYSLTHDLNLPYFNIKKYIYLSVYYFRILLRIILRK